MILVKSFFAYNDLRNYSYLVHDNHTGNAWVIDPFDATPIIDYIKKNGMMLKGILNTHRHFDHIQGNALLMEAFKAPVMKLTHEQKVQISSEFDLQVLDTPGHTRDHQAFVWKEKERPLALFSGDTLFNAGVGNCRSGGNAVALYQTTMKLMRDLPAQTLLYPGHDYRERNLKFAQSVEPENKVIQERLKELENFSTEDMPPVTLEEEFKVNPFFRLDSAELKRHVSKKDLNNEQIFIQLRQLRDHW